MRLLLISLDAAFKQDAQTLLGLPALGRLADEGVFCDSVQTIYPTLTYPVHTSLLTGCYPDRHGIDHNEKDMPRLPAAKRPWYWDADEIKAETLHQAAFKAGREVASILWPVSGHNTSLRYSFPEVHALPGENQTLKMLRYGSFRWLLESEIKYGKTRPSSKQPHLDRFAALLAQKLIEKQYNPDPEKHLKSDVEPTASRKAMHMPDMLTLHLVDLDAARHAGGVHSEEARAAMIRLDQCLGRILKALEAAGVMKDTVIAVVSDHGQADVTRVLALNEWLKASGLPARAQTLGMGAYIRCDRGAYQQVYDALSLHRETLRLKHIYTRQELRQMHAPEGLLMAVEPEDGIEILDHLHDAPHAATHGFGIDHPAAQCLLWLCGPPFLKGARLHSCSIVDVAPTLARAVHLELKGAQGRVLQEAFLPPE
ncbi:MAG: alkaline phosphatase family protein [Christensenellales bacterium]